MIGEYRTTYIVQNQEIIEQPDGTATLRELGEARAYVVAKIDSIMTVLDMKRLVVTFPVEVDMSAEIGTLLANGVSDMFIDGLKTQEAIPFKNLYTRAFDNRLKVFDPHSDGNHTVAYVSMRTPSVRNDTYSREWANDLVINSPTETLDNALVAVNGYFHKTTLYGGELFVGGGYANMKRAGVTETALVDTTALGGHTTIPITADMVHNIGAIPLSRAAKIVLPSGNTFANKTAMLVIHGRLFMLNQAYQIISPDTMKINMNQIDLVHMITHHPLTKWTRNYRLPGYLYQNDGSPSDPDALPALYDDTNPLYTDPIDMNGVVDTDALLTDSYITNLFTEGHSFIVLLNEPNIYIRRYYPWASFTPGQYELQSEDTPRGILMFNKSWALPYTILTSKDRQHTLSIAPRRLGDDLYKTMTDQSKIEAPWFDTHAINRDDTVELIELYRV